MKNLFLFVITASYLVPYAFAHDEGKWAVPNVVYSCKAQVGQDWSRGKEDSSVYAKTEEFQLKMRGSSKFLNLGPKDFVEFRGDLKSFVNTDLEDFEVSLRVGGAGDNGAVLESHFSFQTEDMNIPVSVEAKEYSGGGIPKELNVATAIRAGGRKEISKNGPLYMSVDCTLKSTF